MTSGRLTRREFLRASAAAAAGLMVAACGQTPPQAADTEASAVAATPQADVGTRESADNVELIFWNYWPEIEPIFKGMLDKFHEQHSTIKVKYELLPWDQYWQKLNATLVTGNPPDVWYTAPTFYFEYVDRGQLVELTPLITVDKDIKEDDWFPKALDQWRTRPEGKLYGLPSDFVAQVVFYNKDIFDKAGVKYPTADWTWDDFRSMAKQLTKTDSSGKTEIWGCTAPTGQHLDQIIESNGGEVINEDQSKCMLTANPVAAETIQFMADLIHKDKVAPPTGEFEGMGDPFLTGRIAMHFGLEIGVIGAKAASFAWSNQLIPKGKVKRTNYGGANGFVISSPTKHPTEAFELVKFLTSQAGPALYVGTGLIPVRTDLAQDPAFLNQPSPPDDYSVWTKAVENSDHNYGRGFNEWQTAKNSALEAVFLGNSPAQQEVGPACAAMDAVLDKIKQEKAAR